MPGPRAPLSVRINDGVTDRHVTLAVRDLTYRITAPGGFDAASMRLLLPADTFTDLGPADKVWVYDDRTGATLWEGSTENPGTQDGPSGQGWSLSCLGTRMLATDESRALIYIDGGLDKWERAGGPASANIQASGDPSDSGDAAADGLLCQFVPGQPISTNTVAKIAYNGFVGTGMEFGWLVVTTTSGKTDTGYRNQLRYNTDPVGAGGSVAVQSSTTISTTPVTNSRVAGEGAGHPPTGTVRIALQLIRTGVATNIADDTTYSFFSGVKVSGRRMDRNGTLLTGIAGLVTGDYVLASSVVEDLLGRVLTFCDKGASRVDATTWQIDQLAYPEGVKPAQLLEDLSLWEPDYVWEMLHSTPSGYVFNYRAWPTDVRYEISTSDGYTMTGSDIDLCNRIAVYWTDSRGGKQTTIVTQTVPALGTRIRDAEPVTLPDGQGSVANATRIGQQVLAAKANPPKAATALVRRPILDRLTGNMVWPWEIRPGYLVRVRETGDVLRLTEIEYDDNEVATTLTLGQPVLTMEQRVARLTRKVA